MSGYRGFAYFYDRLTKNVPYEDMARQIEHYTEKYGANKGILLDLACGTGSLCEQLAGLGFDVIGVDGSQDMLNHALDKKFDSGLPIQYLAQDMRKLDMFGTIDVTVCTLDSINHLGSFDDVQTVFDRVSLFAEPGGLFIFDVNTLYKHRDILADNAYIYSFEDVYCGWQNEYDNSDSSVQIWLDIFEKTDTGWTRYSEDLREIYLPPELTEQMLEKAGLKLLGVFDGYTDTPLRECSERAVYVCKKPTLNGR